MTTAAILAEADIETPRLASELRGWWDSKHAAIVEARKGGALDRQTERLSKPFDEEILPLVVLMETVFPDYTAVRCAPVIGNQNYDAELAFPDRTRQKVEVTMAKDGMKDEAMRMRLSKLGSCDSTHEPRIIHRRKKGWHPEFREEGQSRRHDEVVEDVAALIRAAFENKAQKTYAAGTLLVIGFPDERLRAQKDQGFFDALHSRLPHNFSAVYLVGLRGRIFCPHPGVATL